MEGNTSMIAALRDIRHDLQQQVAGAENIRRKLVGSRPVDEGPSAPDCDNVMGIIGDIQNLVTRLAKAQDEHVNVIGNAPEIQKATAARGY